MSYNYRKLSGRIVEVFGTQAKFAEAMELSERTISLKMNNKRPLTQTEITKASNLLNIKGENISDYFFTR